MKYLLSLLTFALSFPACAMMDHHDHGSHQESQVAEPAMMEDHHQPDETIEMETEMMDHSEPMEGHDMMDMPSEHENHNSHMEMMPHHSDDPATEAYMHIHHTMHEAMNIDFTGDADIDFLRGMIPHHQGAIDMAAVQQQYGQDGSVKFFTNKVTRDQIKEIRWMKILLATLEYERGEKLHVEPDSIAFNKRVNAHMHQAMNIDYSDNADVDFMRGMIPHHQGAIDMSQVVLEYGTDTRVKALARSIIDAQVNEIVVMKKWLSRLNWRPAAWRFGAW